LGIVLYVLSTGKSHQDFPEPPEDISALENRAQWLEFDAIVHKACLAVVSGRYQNAEAMHQELALLQRGQSVRENRAVRWRWGIVKKIGFALAVLALLIPLFLAWKGAKHGYTPNPEAARLYKQGQWFYSQLTPEAHVKALQYLSQAAQADPKFVQPYGEWLMLYTWNMVPDSSTEQRRLEHVREIAKKALAIDPNAAEGHTALSWCKFLLQDWRGAEDEIRRAIQLNPNLPTTHDVYCFYLSMQGRTDEARREGQKAEELEPPDSARVTAIVASWPYVADRRFDLAIPQLRRALDLDRNFAWGHAFLARCYESQSNYLAAIEEYRTSALALSNDRARINTGYDELRQALAEQGNTGYLRKWIELIRADESLPQDQQLFRNDIVGYYARLGEKEKALDELEKHFGEPQVWHQIKFIATYDSLHDEKRFKALVKRARLQP
jgi:tetratricopeptide (TPR) repeat protein